MNRICQKLTAGLILFLFSPLNSILFASSKSGKYGSWGVLEYVGQNINDAPKYHALIDNLCGFTSVPTAKKNLQPASIRLEQNYPNPFNPSTKITFNIGTYGHTSLRIFDILGREIVTLVNGVQIVCEHTVEWNGKNSSGQMVGSGIYLCNLRAGDISLTKKLLLLK